jgi:FkbM family methyltransferase
VTDFKNISRRFCRMMRPLERLPRPFGHWSVVGRYWTSLVIDPKGTHGIAQTLINGRRSFVDPSEDVGRFLAYGFSFEQFEIQLFDALVRGEDVILDVGANFGLYSLLAEPKLSAAGCVHVFEPNPHALSLLRRNFEGIDSPSRVQIHAMAVGADVGTVRFFCSEDSAFSSVIENRRHPVRIAMEVPQTTLDAFVSEHSLPRVDLLKIDVEGYEPEILAGATRLLTREDAPIVFIEIATPNLGPRGVTQEEMIGRLESFGYDVRVAEAGLLRARDLSSLDQHENFVAVKPPRLPRLLEGARFAT